MRKIFALFAFAALCSCGGGGGHGPSEPVVNYPNLAGTWTGLWRPSILQLSVRMTITQGTNGHFTGTFTALSSTFEIAGDATPGLVYSWRALNGGCGSLTGSGQVNSLSPTSMTGSIDLNTIGCPSGNRYVGDVALTRTSSTPLAEPQRGDLSDLERALRGMMPR